MTDLNNKNLPTSENELTVTLKRDVKQIERKGL